MTTMVQERQEPQRAAHMLVCQHCGQAYDYRKSLSSLRMTFCGVLCEIADLGYSIDGMLSMQKRP